MPIPELLGPLTRAEAMKILYTQMSTDDLRRLEASPDGQAMLAAFIDPFVELSEKLDRTISARHLLARSSDVNPPASGAQKASAGVEIQRSRVGTALTLPARSRACLVVTEEGHEYELTAAVTFAAGFAGPHAAAAEARVAGFASTVIAGRIVGFADSAFGASGDKATVTISGGKTYLERTAAGDRFFQELVGLYLEFVAGANVGKLARVVALVEPSGGSKVEISGDGLVAEVAAATWEAREWRELGLTVTQPLDSTQGRDDELDELARDRGRQRQDGESEDSLRAAILAFADTISPPALLRLCNRALGVYGPAQLYEAGTSEIECVTGEGDRPFPGFVWGLTPLGIAPDGLAAPVDEVGAPPAGLACLAKSPRHFMVRWDGAGLDDPGSYWKASTGLAEDDAVPMGFAWGLSPLGGFPIGDEAIRAAISVGLDKIRGGGVRWSWYPRYW